MRDIKFRGWETYGHGQWVYGLLTRKWDNYFIEHEIDGKLTLTLVDIESIGEYTGLKDKNANEIYEKDIIEGWKESHWHDGKDKVLKEVEWINELAGFNVIQIEMRECEIIGNSYENNEIAED